MVELGRANYAVANYVFDLVHSSKLMHQYWCMSMGHLTDEAVIERLKEWMAMSGTRLTDLAEEIDVPYRTLQNHFRGVSKMPAATLLKILDRFKLNSAHLRPGVHIIDTIALSMALTQVFGSELPNAKIENSQITIEMIPEESRSNDERRHSSMLLAMLISEAYTEHELRNFFAVERKNIREKRGSQ